jgi:hypothetical protein
MWFVFKTTHNEDSGYIKVHRERDRRIIRGEEVRGTMLRDYREYFIPNIKQPMPIYKRIEIDAIEK